MNFNFTPKSDRVTFIVEDDKVAIRCGPPAYLTVYMNFTDLDEFIEEAKRRMLDGNRQHKGFDLGSPDGDKTVAVIKCVCGALLNTDVGGKRVCPNCGVEVELTHEV